MRFPVLSRLLILLSLCCVLSVSDALAQQSDTDSRSDPIAIGNLTVGTKIAPPFAMKDDQGQWHGISIDLMNIVANRLITPEREQIIDFTHQYFGSGLAIVTPERYQPGWKSMLKALVSPQFLATIFLLCCVLSFVGVIIWVLESKRNSGQFGESPAKGIGNGFWFAAVTMTTVGYGDKAPITVPGRVVSVIWMFAALILTAFLTAQLTTILTAQQAENVVSSIEDLPAARVGNSGTWPT